MAGATGPPPAAVVAPRGGRAPGREAGRRGRPRAPRTGASCPRSGSAVASCTSQSTARLAAAARSSRAIRSVAAAIENAVLGGRQVLVGVRGVQVGEGPSFHLGSQGLAGARDVGSHPRHIGCGAEGLGPGLVRELVDPVPDVLQALVLDRVPQADAVEGGQHHTAILGEGAALHEQPVPDLIRDARKDSPSCSSARSGGTGEQILLGQQAIDAASGLPAHTSVHKAGRGSLTTFFSVSRSAG